MSPPNLHICIVGAGLGGLAAAIGISRAGHTVTILEQASQLSEVGAGIQIPPNASRILARWNLLLKIESHSVRPQAFNLRSYRSGKILSTQETLPYCEKRYGAPYLHIHRADYHNVLVTEAKRLGVIIRLNSRVESIDFATPAIVLSTGETLSYDLIIGADGLKSACRSALLGKPDPPLITGDLAYRIVVPTSSMKTHPSLIEFIENPAINIWMGPSSHAVTYLLQNGTLFNIVLACPDNLPEFIQSEKADLKEMTEWFGDWDPRLRELLGLVLETSKWRLMNSDEMDHWSHPLYPGNFVLLGDACHATLPYLASGAAIAVEDGAVLGELLSKERISSKSQLGDVVKIFEKMRKERTTRVVKGSSAQGKCFHLPDGEEQRKRDEIMISEQENPGRGYPNKWRDPEFQQWLWGYDVEGEVERVWGLYEKGCTDLAGHGEDTGTSKSLREEAGKCDVLERSFL